MSTHKDTNPHTDAKYADEFATTARYGTTRREWDIPISGDATKRRFNRAMLRVDFLRSVWNQPGVTTERY